MDPLVSTLALILLALIGAPIYLWKHGIDGFLLGLFLFYVVATGMSITLGYHRLFAHKAFRAKPSVKLATLIFGQREAVARDMSRFRDAGEIKRSGRDLVICSTAKLKKPEEAI